MGKAWCCCARCKAGEPHTNPSDRYYGAYLRSYEAICAALGFDPKPISEEEAWDVTSAVLDVFEHPQRLPPPQPAGDPIQPSGQEDRPGGSQKAEHEGAVGRIVEEAQE